MARGKKTGGRVHGSLNKRTVERLEREKIADKVRAEVMSAARAESEFSRKRAKDVLEEFLPIVRGITAYYQPTFPGMQSQNPYGSEPKFKEWFGVLLGLTKVLAPYQDATFQAIKFEIPSPIPVNQPATIEGNVVRMTDPHILTRVYATMVKATG